jgi:hypothetical protein
MKHDYSTMKNLQKDSSASARLEIKKSASPVFSPGRRSEAMQKLIKVSALVVMLLSLFGIHSKAQNLIGPDLQWTFPSFDSGLGMNEFYGTASGAIISPCDINGDGYTDFVRGYNTENPGLGFWIHNGTATPAFTYSGDNPYGIVTAGVGARIHPVMVDYDNDGLLDILAATGSGGIRIWMNSGTTTAPDFSSAPVLMTSLTPTGGTHSADLQLFETLEMADFNGDGLFDLLGSYVFTDVDNNMSSITVLALNEGSLGNPIFSSVQSSPYGLDLSGISVHPFYKANLTAYDKDGDGDLDLLGMSGTACTVFYVENTGNATTPQYNETTIQFNISTFYNSNYEPFDINNDGVMDYLSGQDIGRVFSIFNVNSGCTDVNACNYDAQASSNDGSCEYVSCAGCVDEGACNFDPEASINDGSCEYSSCAACMEEEACNYDPEALINDWELCDYSCLGCMDESACNFDAEATLSDPEMCEYTFDFEIVEFLDEQPLLPGNNLIGQDPVGQATIRTADTDEVVSSFSFSLTEEDMNFYLCLDDGCYSIQFTYPEEFEGLEFDLDYGEDTDFDLDGFLNNSTYYFTFGETDCIGGCFDETADNYNPEASFDNESCVYNDFCSNATPLIANAAPISGNNNGATGTWAEDQCLEVDEDDESYVNSVWYALTVPHGPFVVRTILDGTMSDSSIDAYYSCSLGSIIDCNDDDDDLESALYFECDDLETGSTIYIRVDGYDDSVGSFSIVANSLEWDEDQDGCDDPLADNYEECANINDGSCEYSGCMDLSACNFDPQATISSTCDYETCAGCTDEMACNFDPEALISDFDQCEYSFTFENNNVPVGMPGEQDVAFAYISTLDGEFAAQFTIYLESMTFEGFCLEPGCYQIEFDVPAGYEGNSWSISLDGIDTVEGDFGSSDPIYFSLGDQVCPAGCLDEEADNYDFFAVLDDGSCIYNDFCISAEELMVDGATLTGDNTLAGGSLNEADCFDGDDVINSLWFTLEVPEGAFLIRTVLDGSMDDSMMEVYENCSDTESIACNDDEDDLESQVEFECGELVPGEWIYIRIDGYDESIGSFSILAESIEEENEGCTDESAVNYDACANIDDDSCQFEGCTDENAVNFDETATVDDGSCEFEGCTDLNASNFDEIATIDDGSCEYEGCTDENAVNFDETATVDDGSCEFEGCTDEDAANYDENATIDDGSCEYDCFEPTVAYDTEGCNDEDETFSIQLGVLNTEISGPFIISNNLNDDELMVSEDGDYIYGEFDNDQEVVINLTSISTPNCFVSSNILACPLSLDEEVEMEWNMYPNPANNSVSVSLDPTLVERISVYDTSGRLLESIAVNEGLTEFNTAEWAAGIYYVKALGANMVATKTLIIQH